MAYSLFDFTDRGWADDALEDVIAAAQRLGFAGLNVTYPFKQAVLPLMDRLSDAAKAVGAVNTIAFAAGERVGHNTDLTGFAAGFRHGFVDMAPGRVLQLGCGGAGAATAHALLGSLAAEHVVLYDPEAARCDALRVQLAAQHGADRVSVTLDPARAAAGVDGLLNASPTGIACVQASSPSAITTLQIFVRRWT